MSRDRDSRGVTNAERDRDRDRGALKNPRGPSPLVGVSYNTHTVDSSANFDIYLGYYTEQVPRELGEWCHEKEASGDGTKIQ